MKKNSLSIKKLITIMMVLALLVMALPMTVVAKGRDAANMPGQAKGLEKQALKNGTDDEDTANLHKSKQAQLVAARNEWAKETIGIPPGQANLMLKMVLAADTGLTEDSSVEDIMTALGDFYKLNLEPLKAEFTNPDETINYKAFLVIFKQLRLEKPDDEDEPESPEVEPDTAA